MVSTLDRAQDAPRVHPVQLNATPLWQRVMSDIAELLTEEQRAQMETEIGKAMVQSIQCNHDGPINRAVDAWVRSVSLLADGRDALEVDAGSAQVYSIEDLQRRFSA